MNVKSETSSRFAILPEGGLKEEAREWEDIETMCRTGRLSPDALIFLPEENVWRKLSDTALAACFRRREPVEAQTDRVASDKMRWDEEYEALAQQIRLDPRDTALRLRAAEVARAMGQIDAACGHYQEALDISPYHPRVAQEAKRNLPLSKWKRLRFLEKPPQVWEDPAAIFAYPFARGPLYLAVSAALLTGLFWTAWTAVPAFLLSSLWAVETIRSNSRGDRRPPLCKGLFADPFQRIAKPLAGTVAAALEISGVFAGIAGVLVVAHLGVETNVLLTIRKSPVLTVLLCTVSVFYLPAVMMLAAAPATRLRDIVNPKRIVRAIRVMETEYVLSVFFVALLFFAVWGAGTLLDSIPVVGRVFYAAAAAYLILAGGFVFGRLNGRFEEQLVSPAPTTESSPE
jgi:hypothetical protein